MDSSLPAAIIDLIRDGVPPADLRRQGPRAVWNALVRTAASAKQRGWDQWEWADLVQQRQSRLGIQAGIERGKPINERRLRLRLEGAWAAAEKWIDDKPPAWSREDVLAELGEIRRWMEQVEMTDDQRTVMNHAVDTAERHGTTRPALPWRQVSGATGLNPRRTRAALESLGEAGLLVLAQRGYAGATKRRANLYRLPDSEARATTYQYRGTRSMDQSARSMDHPEGTPVDHRTDLWTNPSDRVTISGSAQAVAQLLHGRVDDTPTEEDQTDGHLADVIDISSRRKR